jgi:hypothetical protein
MGRRVLVGGLADSAGFRSVHSHRWAAANAPDRMLWMLTLSELEPVSGFEPLTCRLQEDRPGAPDALAAAMTWAIALTALVTLGLSGDPVHEPVHAGEKQTHRCNRAR